MILLNKLFSAKKSAKARVDYPLLLLGAVIYGVSVGLVLSPNEIAPGGASGLAVMLSRFLPLGVGSLTMAINLPLLAVSLYVFGWRFLLGTVVAIAVSGLTADMCTLFTPLTNDIFLSAIAGGILLGAGGLVRAYSHSCALALDAAQDAGEAAQRQAFLKWTQGEAMTAQEKQLVDDLWNSDPAKASEYWAAGEFLDTEVPGASSLDGGGLDGTMNSTPLNIHGYNTTIHHGRQNSL